MSEFKRGDRVKVLQPYGDVDGNPPFNTEGTVLRYSGITYLIEFKGWFAGSTAGLDDVFNKWWMCPQEIGKVE